MRAQLFDYNGFSMEEVEYLSAEHHAEKLNSPWVYWSSEIYSFGKHFRDYAFYPRFLPLFCYSSHGANIGSFDDIARHEIENDAPFMLYFSPDTQKLYKYYSQKPSYCVLNPFVWYRKSQNIHRDVNAKGTLAFLPHSTQTIDILNSYEDYLAELRALPPQYHPICLCISHHDVKKGNHKVLYESEFPVYTVGDCHDHRFAERFYEIVRHFKYTTAPMIGSNSYYSIEMGIPFFLYGKTPIYFAHGDENNPRGECDWWSMPNYKYQEVMLSSANGLIKPISKVFVEKHLGVYDSISRLYLSYLFYKAFLVRGVPWLLKKIIHKIKKIVKMKLYTKLRMH